METKQPIKCKACGYVWYITHTFSGKSCVQPGEWFVISSERWDAKCECRHVRRPTEGELYRALGITYA